MEENENSLLKSLKEYMKTLEGMYDRKKKYLPRYIEGMENLVRSKDVHRTLEVLVEIGKKDVYQDLALLSSNLHLLSTIALLILRIKILENYVAIINKELVQSGILEKANDIDEIKRLKELLKAQYEKMKKRDESHKKDLNYIY